MAPVLILGLLGIAGAGYLLLRKTPEQKAFVEALTADPELYETVTEAAAVMGAKETTLAVAKDAVQKGDILGAAVAVLAFAITARDWRDKQNDAWAGSIIAVWHELPDSWFLERTREQAGAEVETYLPPRKGVIGFSWADMFNRKTNGTAYLAEHYNRVRAAYSDRIDPERAERRRLAVEERVEAEEMAVLLAPPRDSALVEVVSPKTGKVRVTSEALEARIRERV